MSHKHFLETVKWGAIPIVNYRGVNIFKTHYGYHVLGQRASNPKEVDKVLDSAMQTLKNSIQ